MSGGPGGGASGPADATAGWRTPGLQFLARGAVRLPVEAWERSHAEQHRMLILIILGFVLLLSGLLAAVLAAAGVLPELGFGETRPGSLERTLEIVVALPLGLAVLLYGFFYLVFVRRRADEDDHPWRFRATGEEFSVQRQRGTALRAPWSRWRYEGYRYSIIKNQTVIVALELSLEGERMAIDLKRTRRSRDLMRAVLQRLAAHGITDRDGAT